MGDAQDRLFAQVRPDQLQADRQAGLSKPHGTLMPHMPARFSVIVKTSLRYISSGLSVFSPMRKAVVGATGQAITSTCRKGPLEILLDQRAHLLRLEIVGVVVAGAQGIGAEHDAPLDLGAKALAA